MEILDQNWTKSTILFNKVILLTLNEIQKYHGNLFRTVGNWTNRRLYQKIILYILFISYYSESKQQVLLYS